MLQVVPEPAPLHDVVLIDLSYIHRRFWHSTADEVTSTAYTETVRAVHAWRDLAEVVIVCLDCPPYKRAEILPSYKGNRQAPPAELKDQLKRIVARLKTDGFPILWASGFEADDVIATACRQLTGRRVAVVTGDKDARQLVGKGVVVIDPSTIRHYDSAAVFEEHGVQPSMIPELLALTGDAADNVPGVAGVGPKTAVEWLTTYGGIDALLQNAHQLSEKKRAALLAADVRRDLALVRLDFNAPIDVLKYIQTSKEAHNMADTTQPATNGGNGTHAAVQKTISARYDFRRKVETPKPEPRFVLIGEPGVGKTTLITEAPNPVLIPTEDGALGAKVQRIPVEGKVRDWADLLGAVGIVAHEQHDFKTIGIDTFTGAYGLCAQMVCDRDFDGKWTAERGSSGFSAFGKGDEIAAKEFKALLDLLDICQQKRGMFVILVGHVALHKQGNALGADFQKFGGDMGKKAWANLCAWADQVGHGCRDFHATTASNETKAKARAVDDARWIVFEGGPGRDCKSRVGFEMSTRVPLRWDDYFQALKADRIGPLVEQAADLAAKAPVEQQRILSARLGGAITHDALRAIGAAALTKTIGWLMAAQNINTQQGA